MPTAAMASAAEVAADDRAELAEESPTQAIVVPEGQVEPSEPVQPVYDVPRQLSVTRDGDGGGPVVVRLDCFFLLTLRRIGRGS